MIRLRLGATIHSAYTVSFQTHVFSALPSSFTVALKELVRWTLSPPTEDDEVEVPPQIKDGTIWGHFDTLGLIDRYETLIASVCYEHIEDYVIETCAENWNEPMLAKLRSWMGNTVVPWMIMPYARGAKTCEPLRTESSKLLLSKWQLTKPETCSRALDPALTFTFAKHSVI
jgi:anaphase-promoting complex subunit 2